MDSRFRGNDEVNAGIPAKNKFSIPAKRPEKVHSIPANAGICLRRKAAVICIAKRCVQIPAFAGMEGSFPAAFVFCLAPSKTMNGVNSDFRFVRIRRVKSADLPLRIFFTDANVGGEFVFCHFVR